mgnify:CR=1 FL=1
MIGCRKGGVGKTTSTVNLAYELSKRGERVLVLDFDGQANTTNYFKRLDTEFFIGDILTDRKADIRKAIYPAIVKGEELENLHIVPSRKGDVMTRLDMDMQSLAKRDERLKRHLDPILDDYDFVLIDTSPSTSVIFLNAVTASTEFIFPTEYAQSSIEGIEELLEHIQNVTFQDEDEINFMVVPTKVHKSSKRAFEQYDPYLRDVYEGKVSKAIIWHRSAIFNEAEYQLEPVSVVKPGDTAAMFYKSLAREVVDNV